MSIFPTRILLAIDGSKDAQLAASAAIELANKTDSELHVVHARLMVPWTAYPAAGTTANAIVDEEEARQSIEQWLDDQVKSIEAEGGNVAQAYLRLGSPDEGIIPVAEKIVSLAEEIGAGLVVVGSRGLGGIRRALMGSVSDAVVRHAHCPVLVVRGEGREEEASIFPTKFLLATDGSEEATLAAETAAEITRLSGSEPHVVYVEEYPPHLLTDYGALAYLDAESIQTMVEEADSEARKTLDEQVGRIEGAGGTVPESHLRQGRPDIEIVELAEEIGAGLIVMGSRGLGGMRRALMGSVSDSVVRHAHCPVLIVRQEKAEEVQRTIKPG